MTALITYYAIYVFSALVFGLGVFRVIEFFWSRFIGVLRFFV